MTFHKSFSLIKVLHWDWKVSGSNSPMYLAGFVGPISLWGSRYSLGWNKVKTQWLTLIYWSCPIDSGPSWLWGSQVAGKKSEKNNQKQTWKQCSFERKQEKDSKIELMSISIKWPLNILFTMHMYLWTLSRVYTL